MGHPCCTLAGEWGPFGMNNHPDMWAQGEGGESRMGMALTGAGGSPLVHTVPKSSVGSGSTHLPRGSRTEAWHPKLRETRVRGCSCQPGDQKAGRTWEGGQALHVGPAGWHHLAPFSAMWGGRHPGPEDPSQAALKKPRPVGWSLVALESARRPVLLGGVGWRTVMGGSCGE